MAREQVEAGFITHIPLLPSGFRVTQNKQTSNIFRCEKSPVGSQVPEFLLGVLSGSQAPHPTPTCSYITLTGWVATHGWWSAAPTFPSSNSAASDT